MVLLEVLQGQFTSSAAIKCWDILPLLRGVGFASVWLVFMANCYYNVLLTWTFRYLFASFTTDDLPWTSCSNDWNTEHCMEDESNHFNLTTLANDPATEYWEYEVLGISRSIDQVIGIKWDLAGCLLLAWILVFLCICNGIRTSGRVMYVTVTLPYLILLILFIRAMFLPGSVDGLVYYLKPDFSRLTDLKVWSDAGGQVYFSYMIANAVAPAMGSYNKWNHNSARDVILLSVADSLTAIFSVSISDRFKICKFYFSFFYERVSLYFPSLDTWHL